MNGSPPSPQAVNESSPPLAVPASKPSSRRLPPPCWSHDETIALIDAYRDKWYSLRRGNLKAFHWQEVADAVSARCPLASPAKTAVQCRHKMEKLRKRYRTEIQRSKSIPVSRFISSWVHFKRMDAMEKGPALAKPVDNDDSESDDEDENDADLDGYEYPDAGRYSRNGGGGNRGGTGLVGNGVGGRGYTGGNGAGAGGFRIKIPNGVSVATPGMNFRTEGYENFDDDDDVPRASANLDFLAMKNGYTKGLGGKRAGADFGGGKKSGLGKRERGGDGIFEMVSAINMLADGFVKREQKKMEMVREIEVMRMDMENKRLKMILESQERVMQLQAFTKGDASEKKKTENGLA